MNTKSKSLFQERLVGLFLRLNGYLQSGFIPHSEVWGNAGTDIDRIGIRFPCHSQIKREVDSSPLLFIPLNSIDIIVAEVKNTKLSFNKTLRNLENRANENWKQILLWIGLFTESEVIGLTPKLIEVTNCNKVNGKFPIVSHENNFGKISIRPILFVVDQQKDINNDKIWINGDEILEYLWECLCPVVRRNECSTSYNINLWGTEYSDIVNYLKERNASNKGIGTLEEIYVSLIK